MNLLLVFTLGTGLVFSDNDLDKKPTFTSLTWESPVIEGNTESISEGSANVCLDQPNKETINQLVDSCKDNAECGTALCVKIHAPAFGKDTNNEPRMFNRCGCSEFEEFYDGQKQVQVCSCLAVLKEFGDSCLPVWQDSIMCKFTCKDCLACPKKRTKIACQKDYFCKWTGDNDSYSPSDDLDVAPCQRITSACIEKTDQADCESGVPNNPTACKWVTTNRTYSVKKVSANLQYSFKGVWETSAAVDACRPRFYAEHHPDGSNVKCPVGTTRFNTKYSEFPGTYFDVCTRKEISNCLFYEWDGESCKQCNEYYQPSQVALERGNGKIKKNAICTLEQNAENQACAIFTYAIDSVAGEDHHHCARCKEGFEWPYQAGVHDREEGKCMTQHKENDALFPVGSLMNDARVFFAACFLLGAIIIFAIGKLTGLAKVFSSMPKNDVSVPLEAVRVR